MANREGSYNPKAPVVARKVSGLALGGRRYAQGEAISDDCISVRKRMQLYKQGFICHPHELGEVKAAEPVEGLEGDGSGNVVEENGLTEMENRADREAEASRPEEGSEESESNEGGDEESGDEGSEEPSEPASKKKRRKKKKSS